MTYFKEDALIEMTVHIGCYGWIHLQPVTIEEDSHWRKRYRTSFPSTPRTHMYETPSPSRRSRKAGENPLKTEDADAAYHSGALLNDEEGIPNAVHRAIVDSLGI